MQLPPANQRRRWRSRTREPKQAETFQQRFVILKALIIVLFGALALQLARMQIVEHQEYAARAERNRLRVVPELPARGLIYDRNGVQLVQNVPIFSAGVVPADVPAEALLPVVAELQRLTGAEPAEVATAIVEAQKSDDPFTPLIVKTNLDDETAFRLRERQARLPGIRVVVESIRQYPAGALASHYLGYVGRIDAEEHAELRDQGYLLNDRLGKTGAEYSYEATLRGTPGYRQVEIDAAGQEIRTLSSYEPRPGGNLVLSLDFDLQRRVTEVLQESLGRSLNGVAAVMDVRTGELLSMVSLPAYDNNALTEPVAQEALPGLLNNPAKPLVNHALAEVYPPGSTFKLVTGTAALQEGVASPSTRITSLGSITVGNHIFRDWSALGTLDFYGGVSMSSDVYFYYLAGGYAQGGQQLFRGLGVERLARYAREYGLGAPTGIDLPGEAAGIVPDPEWERENRDDVWTIGDTYHFGIGQGYLAVTPLQLLRVTAAVANGGDVLVPHVAREVVDSNGVVVRRIEREVARRVNVASENLAVMREGMRRAAASGTATSGASQFVEIAAKTGTAEFGPPDAEGDYETHAWYTGFAPYDNPETAVVVFLQTGRGAADAGPVARQIFDYYFGRQHFAQEGGTP